MKKTINSVVSVILVFVCLFAVTACGKVSPETEALWANATYTENTTIGDGSIPVKVGVKAGDKSIVLTVNTNKTTIGNLLLEHGIIAGEESEYGLYIKVVNGITADYDVDQSYWAFYINGEYAMTGVDQTYIDTSATYLLEYTK